ncbi:hypothetical protein ACLB2K_000802 [Fragaria x ananassa]
MSDWLAMIKRNEELVPSEKKRVLKSPKRRRRTPILPGDRNLVQEGTFWADVVVASDGRGDCETVGEALMKANNSEYRFVIRIKAEVYNETVGVSREKALEELLKDYSDEDLLRIHPHGWSKWDEYSRVDTVEYIQYLNFGPGSDTRHRVKWRGFGKNCPEEIAEQFSVGLF